MATPITRRQLFRADFHGRRDGLAPPWAVADFTKACTRCDDCLEACPEGIVVRGDGGYPALDFRRGECTFCGDCVSACEPGALVRANAAAPPWSRSIEIGADCLARQHVACRACGDPCAPGAIRFRPRRGGFALPEVDAELCTGCGACVRPCPVAAVRVHDLPMNPTRRVATS